jgi:hypothetical protein
MYITISLLAAPHFVIKIAKNKKSHATVPLTLGRKGASLAEKDAVLIG